MNMDRMGGMPFAVIAVALLLASTALVATVHLYSDTSEDAGGVLDGIDDADAIPSRSRRRYCGKNGALVAERSTSGALEITVSKNP